MQHAEIERVQRLAEFKHHVVGDVHHRIDGPETRAAQALHHPQRRRLAGVDVAHDAAEIAGTTFASDYLDRKTVIDAGRDRRTVGCLDGQVVEHSDFPGDALERQAIPPVRCQVQRYAAIVERQRFANVGTRGTGVREFEDAVRLVSQSEFRRRAQHAVRFHAPDIAGAYLDIGQRRARSGKWGFHADAGVRRPADNLVPVRSVCDPADIKAIGVGMGYDFQYLPHHDARERRGRIGRSVNFEPGTGELFAKGLGIDVRIDPFAQPTFAELHGA